MEWLWWQQIFGVIVILNNKTSINQSVNQKQKYESTYLVLHEQFPSEPELSTHWSDHVWYLVMHLSQDWFMMQVANLTGHCLGMDKLIAAVSCESKTWV